jgi:broad specificity phosphatase PhoE
MMAQGFADHYALLPWQAVYCSPLRRAVLTAQPLCDKLQITPQLRDDLKEIGYGAWEGQSWKRSATIITTIIYAGQPIPRGTRQRR